MKKQQPLLFCVGFGDTARALAQLKAKQGWKIAATSRSPETVKALCEEGIEGLLFDETLPDKVPESAAWLISTPPDENGCPAYNLLHSAAQNAAQQKCSIFYLSTTGVYGDLGGGWAFEWTQTNPQSTAGQRRDDAEKAWRSISADVTLVRLPGIYGPGRSAFDRLREGKARRIIKDGQVFSRVHVDDIAACLNGAIEKGVRGEVLHPCDDAPAPPQHVIAYAAELLGVEVPPDIPFEEAGLSPMAQRFYSECKRISNARTKSLTGWRPAYPDYQSGLQAIRATENQA
ncbi:SDR family oxidoreductase [Ponticaulis sp.]|uniref:SDR family oxidoreductase n=1 Tax=Ponticaulis sp. TaxID=2020902 RepID=UPI000B68419E|nr:SDR family oxidoreductase [Ponticaulis sp.]MAI90167.1 NAD(P)-dependent oxidoreductase [Ponticaulis sp.]OUX99818.1 MAG: hypothetical protein CBB65_06980 [Hyphomonadaceae bacterium TMED5]